MDIQIAADHDLIQVVSLLNRAYRATGGDKGGWTTEVGLLAGDRISEDTLREELAAKRQAVLMVFKPEEKVTGCVWLEPVDGDTWYLGSLAVEPAKQNAQLGRRLLAASEDWIRQKGGRTVKMTVIDDRQELLDWYERRGYRRTGETEPFPATDHRFGTPLKANLQFETLLKTLETSHAHHSGDISG